MTLTLCVTQQLIAAQPKVSCALTGSEVCGAMVSRLFDVRTAWDGVRKHSFERALSQLRHEKL
ncbi:MAG TPA: hypothetical protein VIL70_08065, partial [Chthoniobacterales bacterium]